MGIREELEPTEEGKPGVLSSLLTDFFFTPSLVTAIGYLNLVLGFLVFLIFLSGHEISYWFLLSYVPFVYILYIWRKSREEKDRLQIAHRIPFFADSLANCLSTGMTLERAFIQSSYYLRGKIKEEFAQLIAKHHLGRDLGSLLQELDTKFPNTGLRYLTSLLREYSELGVGISPLLKEIATTLTVRGEAEEKIRTILATGSGYARICIIIFAVLFLGMSFFLKDQILLLFSDDLKPIFIFLVLWSCIGVFLVTRITSMEFARSYSLRPYIKKFPLQELSLNELLGLLRVGQKELWNQFLMVTPIIIGFFCSYVASWYTDDILLIESALALSAYLTWRIEKTILKGLLEDQLIKTIEIFPEVLQIFVIGLNTGLNTYLAFQFAQNGVEGSAPKILSEELCRTKFAMECGEVHARTWQRLARQLPFETVVDFCDIMVVAPMHGESIVGSIVQTVDSYQTKKITHIERKANALSQWVIPLIIASFFPIFLFIVFAPILSQLGSLLHTS